jgi:hypothetical protein
MNSIPHEMKLIPREIKPIPCGIETNFRVNKKISLAFLSVSHNVTAC